MKLELVEKRIFFVARTRHRSCDSIAFSSLFNSEENKGKESENKALGKSIGGGGHSRGQ